MPAKRLIVVAQATIHMDDLITTHRSSTGIIIIERRLGFPNWVTYYHIIFITLYYVYLTPSFGANTICKHLSRFGVKWHNMPVLRGASL